MKFGFITTVGGYQWAGSEELWYETALEAIYQGHSVSISVSSDMKKAFQLKNISQLGGNIYFRERLLHPRLEWFKEYLSSSFNQVLSKSEIVLLSLGSLLDPIFIPNCVQSLESRNASYIILCQFNAESLHLSPENRTQIQKLFDLAIGCVFVSHHNLALAQRQLARNLENACVIYNPIRCKLSEPLPWSSQEIAQLGCVARLETLWKGQDVLLEVLSQPQWRDRNWHLNLYGVGPHEDYIQQLIQHYQLNERVTCHGYIRDIQSVWQQNHLMVLASRGEGTPLAILEAMMCGRPTVTTDVGGNREILSDGETGFIAETATPYSFGKILEKAWEERERWVDMGYAAHQIAKHYAELKPAKQLLNYLVNITL